LNRASRLCHDEDYIIYQIVSSEEKHHINFILIHLELLDYI